MWRHVIQVIIVTSSIFFILFASHLLVAAEPKLTNDQLSEKAKRLQATVEKKIVQQHGLIPMFVRASDYQLPTAEDYKGAYRHRHLLGKTEEEVGIPPMHVWRAWENTPTDTAYYLYAMAYKYRTTGNPETLAICRRTFAALKYIYMLGVNNGEPGYLCKPYGGKYSNQTSADQVQCVVWGLAAYRGIAPPEDVADLDRMCHDFADFIMKHSYYPPKGFLGRSAEELRKNTDYADMKWNRAIMVLPMLHLAWYGTGDSKYVKEINRWYDDCGEEKFSSSNKTELSGKGFDRNRNIYLSSQLMEMNPLREKQWKGRMRSVYLQNRDGILEDGTWLTAWVYNTKTKQLKPEAFLNIGGGGLGRTGRSAIFAMSCVSAQRWLPKENMKEDARKILNGLDEATLRFILPIDDEHPLPAEWKVESQMLDSDSLTAWLCAYWEGRYRGYWTE